MSLSLSLFSDKAIKEKLHFLFFRENISVVSFVLFSLSVYFQIKLQRKDMDEPLTKDLTVALSLDICSNHSLTVREELLLSWKILSRTPQVFTKRNDEKNIRKVFEKEMIVYIIIIFKPFKHTTTSTWKKMEIFHHFSISPPLFFFCN